MKYELVTSLRKGIRDNQGLAVEKVLQQMGYTNVNNVRISKLITFECDGRTKLSEQVVDALVNPVMEDYILKKLS